jgi:hypothetical protein
LIIDFDLSQSVFFSGIFIEILNTVLKKDKKIKIKSAAKLGGSHKPTLIKKPKDYGIMKGK